MFAALQEHFLLENNLCKLNRAFPDYDVFGIPAFKCNSRIHSGRPSSGLAFIYNKKLSKFVTHVSCPYSKRVHGLKFKLPEASYMFINCYFPVDNRNQNNDLLLQILQDVKYIIDQCDDDCNVIMLGDLNVDFRRSTDFAAKVKNFLSDNNLSSVWSKFQCDFTYCHSKLVHGVERSYFSTLDHFCVKPELMQLCVESTPLHLVDNMSNHEPIYLKFKCVPTKVENISYKYVATPKPLWKSADPDNITDFKHDLQHNLSLINKSINSLHCRDVHCVHPDHKQQIDLYANDLMEAISNSVNDNIPFSNPSSNSKSPIPGWNPYIKPFRDDALFWFNVWKSAGKPQDCELHNIMKWTRNKYHYAIRKIRKQDSALRKEKFVEECLSGKINNIFDNIKTSRKRHSTAATTVDGVSGPENITNEFKNIYNNVYNKYDDGKSELSDFFEDLNFKIKQSDVCFVDRISESLIHNIISDLKDGKSDVEFNWGSEAIKHGVDSLSSHFTVLFKALLIHGHIPQLFSFCKLVPLVKGNKSKLSSDNYRLIAISSLILKILDHIILSLFSDNFISPFLQFGFQKGLSTTMCTWGVLETINYFTSRGGSAYVCFLDLTKAFDHVKHDILFKKLSKKVPAIFLRLVLVIYMCQSCSVRWDNFDSTFFTVSNGLRQGAVASPLYFNVYLDDLFLIMKESGLGCEIDQYFYGLFGYADDCALLSPSREGLQLMLNLCANYFAEHGIKISVDVILEKSKTKCMAFNSPVIPIMLSLYNLVLPWVRSAIHLGHQITTDEDTSADILSSKAIFITKVHELRQELGDQNPEVFIRLVQIYLTSMYGSNLWDLYHNSAGKLFSAWNTLIKNSFNLPFATHRHIVYNITNKTHLRVALFRRFIKFYSKLEMCSKPEIVHLFNKQKVDMRSVFGRNCIKICREFNAENISNIEYNDVCMPDLMDESQNWRVPFLQDLLLLNDDSMTDIPKKDLTEIIDFICCH